jgi:hypothetical protein
MTGASAALNKARREQLREELALQLDPITEVRRIDAFLEAERIDVHAVREIISAERTRAILGALAPLAFGRASGLVAEFPMELCRGHQIIRLRVHHDAEPAVEYAGPPDVTCRQWQPGLERAVERQGIVLAKCHQRHHHAGGPAPAGAYGDSSIVWVTVLSTDRDATSTSARRVVTGAHAASSHQG